jgi:hypothetical protein
MSESPAALMRRAIVLPFGKRKGPAIAGHQALLTEKIYRTSWSTFK